MINSLQKNHKEGVSDEMCNLPTADANALLAFRIHIWTASDCTFIKVFLRMSPPCNKDKICFRLLSFKERNPFASHRKKHHGSRYLQMSIANLFYMQYLCRQQKKYFNGKKAKERQIFL